MSTDWQSSKCLERGKQMDGVIILSLIHAGAARTQAAAFHYYYG